MADLKRLGVRTATLAMGSIAWAWGTICGPVMAAERLPELEPASVTVTRMEQPLESIPASVTQIGPGQLGLGREPLGLGPALNQVPGLFVQNETNFAQDERISLRGFGARSAFGVRGVAIVLDGVPQTLPDGQAQLDAIEPGIVERITVLRGTASSLYGNAAGGVIQIETRGPPESPEFGAKQVYGSDDLWRFRLDAGVPLGPGGLRAGLSRLDYEGYREHSSVEQWQAQLKGRWQWADQTTLQAGYGWLDSPLAQDPGGLTAEQARNHPRMAREANIRFDAGEAVRQHRASLRLTHLFGEAIEHEIDAGAFALGRDFANRLPFESGGQVAFDRVFAGTDVRYVAMAGAHTLQAGFDFRRQEDDRQRFDNLEGIRGPQVLHQLEEVLSLGGYLQYAGDFQAGWNVSAGLRWDEVGLQVEDRFLANGDDSGERTWTSLNPSLGVAWRARPLLQVFANASTAFQTPTTTELANPEDPGNGGGFNRALEPERALSLETGLRGSLENGLRYEAVVYRIWIDDAITSFEVPEFSGTGRDFFRNAGESTRDGIELQARLPMGDALEWRMSYAWSRYRFDTFQTPEGDFSGNTLPGVPEHQGTLALDWEDPRGWFGGIEAIAISDLYADNANTAEAEGYVKIDARLGRRWDWGRWSVELFGGIRNGTDERTNGNVRINAFGGRYFEPAPGRTGYVGLRLGARPSPDLDRLQ